MTYNVFGGTLNLTQSINQSICGGIYARVYCIFSACIRCRRKESSRSLSHLLISFLYVHVSD